MWIPKIGRLGLANNKFMKKLFPFFTAALFAPLAASAQGLQDARFNLQKFDSGLSYSLSGQVNIWLSGALYILGAAFLALAIYGGIVWLKSAGRENEIERAKKIIWTTVIGLIVLLASYAIAVFALRATGAG